MFAGVGESGHGCGQGRGWVYAKKRERETKGREERGRAKSTGETASARSVGLQLADRFHLRRWVTFHIGEVYTHLQIRKDPRSRFSGEPPTWRELYFNSPL